MYIRLEDNFMIQLFNLELKSAVHNQKWVFSNAICKANLIHFCKESAQIVSGVNVNG